MLIYVLLYFQCGRPGHVFKMAHAICCATLLQIVISARCHDLADHREGNPFRVSLSLLLHPNTVKLLNAVCQFTTQELQTAPLP